MTGHTIWCGGTSRAEIRFGTPSFSQATSKADKCRFGKISR